MCVELLCKPHDDWTLHFIAGAVAVTDVPVKLLDLIKQRRRWLNGSFFSLVFYVFRFHQLLSRSNHSIGRQLILFIQFVYQVLALVLTWFTVGTLYLCLYLVFRLSFEGSKYQGDVLMIPTVIYGMLSFVQVQNCITAVFLCMDAGLP
jgi:chitin synthase